MCTRPITITLDGSLNKDGKLNFYRSLTGKTSIQVPCGKCPECLISYQNSWQIRLLEEFKRSKIGVFFTLTYAPENVPTADEFLSVDKTDLSPMLKRFRTRLSRGSGKTFKYFITSEYGPTTLRPHYHGLFFGLSLLEALPFLQEWKKTKGFVKFDFISYSGVQSAQGVCRYVAKYCCKGDFENPLVEQKLVDSSFHLISKGLGISYLTDLRLDYHRCVGERFPNIRAHAEEVVRRLQYPLNGFNYKLPRYYREKILEFSPRLSYEVTNVLFEKSCVLRDSELESIRTAHSSTSHEAYGLSASLSPRKTFARETDARTKLSKFYSKSKL